MEATSSWKALVDPGDADDFFGIDDLPAFDAGASQAYARGNALRLAEICRLVYREDRLTRRRFFRERADLDEIRFFDVQAAQGALVQGNGFAVLVFRGTLGLRDWFSNLDCPPVEWEGEGKVHQGFKKQLDLVWPQVRAELDKLDVPVFYTGHSLGAALATLAAARRFCEKGAPPAALYSFGSPRVGTSPFAAAFPPAFLHCRVVNGRDVVATVPPRRLSSEVFGAAFRHVGLPHHVLREGILDRSKPGDDETPSLFETFGKLWREDLARIAQSGNWSSPEHFIDHAPVNYTARIEKAADEGGDPKSRGD